MLLVSMRTGLHPEVVEVMEIFDALGVQDAYKLGAQATRELFGSLKADPQTYPAIHSVTNTEATGQNTARIPVRIFRPNDDQNLPVLVWFHGGGWVFGTLDSTEIPGRDLANEAKCVVVGVDYRLAPETPFPGAFDDCLAVTNWVHDNSGTLGIDPTRIAVGGDSAGGNLAACVALACKDGHGPALIHQLLIYPVIDPEMSSESYSENGEGYFLSGDAMSWFWDCYVPEAAYRTDPRVDPRTGDLSGLASAWVFTAGFDPLRDEGRAYADDLEAAGVAVDRMEQSDVIHGTFGMAIQRGAEARSAAAASLARAFAKPS